VIVVEIARGRFGNVDRDPAAIPALFEEWQIVDELLEEVLAETVLPQWIDPLNWRL